MDASDGKLSVFVDLDNTIVYQSHWPDHPAKKELEEQGGSPYTLSALQPNQLNERLPEGTRAFNSNGLIIAVRRRPHAQEFLGKLKALVGSLCLLTHGRTAHQTKVLELSGLDSYFSVVVGRDRYKDIVPQKDKNWLLLDDLDPRDPTCMSKLNGLGVISNRALKVFDSASEQEVSEARERVVIMPAYDGEMENDGLLRVWPEVERKIRTFGRLNA
jgi:phosphoglycolate phosphatase-like HAD superfamily hydrolase